MIWELPCLSVSHNKSFKHWCLLPHQITFLSKYLLNTSTRRVTYSHLLSMACRPNHGLAQVMKQSVLQYLFVNGAPTAFSYAILLALPMFTFDSPSINLLQCVPLQNRSRPNTKWRQLAQSYKCAIVFASDCTPPSCWKKILVKQCWP